jgi:hypothetical protein
MLTLTYRRGYVMPKRGSVVTDTYTVRLKPNAKTKRDLRALAANLPPELAAALTPRSSTNRPEQACKAGSIHSPRDYQSKVDTSEAPGRTVGKLYRRDTAIELAGMKDELVDLKAGLLQKLMERGVPPEELSQILQVLKAEVRVDDVEETSSLATILKTRKKFRREQRIKAPPGPFSSILVEHTERDWVVSRIPHTPPGAVIL